jgi:RNAse (barnase) inhibitor barstar
MSWPGRMLHRSSTSLVLVSQACGFTPLSFADSISEARQAVKAVYEIDGRDFATLEEFYGVVSRVLIPGAKWGHNLDAFNDILRGGFGTPEGGFILLWKNSAVSRRAAGLCGDGAATRSPANPLPPE